jgi:hypothetical protein
VQYLQLDASARGVETPDVGAAVIQKRAYSSPFWYRPYRSPKLLKTHANPNGKNDSTNTSRRKIPSTQIFGLQESIGIR